MRLKLWEDPDFISSISELKRKQRLSFITSVRDDTREPLQQNLSFHPPLWFCELKRRQRKKRSACEEEEEETHAVLPSDGTLADIFGSPRQLLKHRRRKQSVIRCDTSVRGVMSLWAAEETQVRRETRREHAEERRVKQIDCRWRFVPLKTKVWLILLMNFLNAAIYLNRHLKLRCC